VSLIRAARVFSAQNTKTENIYDIPQGLTFNIPKGRKYIPNGRKNTNIFNSKTFPNVSQKGIFGMKIYTIWHP
jgi:hypothetical protein